MKKTSTMAHILCSVAAATGTLFLCNTPALSQQAAPLVNPSASTQEQSNRIEAEQISIGNRVAMPSAIHRPSGSFLLVISNKTVNHNASFVLDPDNAGEGTLSSTPVLTFPGTMTEKRQLAGLLELTKGVYYLKSSPAGHILCTITIE